MRFPVLFVAAALIPLSVCAQPSPQQPVPQASGAAAASSGKPANLCQELIAFVHQPEPTLRANAQPAQQATAVEAPKK